MFTVKITGAKEMVADLKRMREKAIPYALKNALTTAAFETRSIWQREIRSTFVNRNTYTANSVRVEQASTTKLVAKTGSIADYMDEQEEGATIKGSGKHKAIPTAAAAGQAGGGKRTKLVRGRFYLGAIQVAHPALSGGRRQQNAIAIAVARKKGQKVVLLNRPKGGKALFLMGAGTKRKLKTRMLWDVSRGSVKVKPEPTLERSIAQVKPKLEHMMQASFAQQMQRFSIGT
jgi:hypothetical protein